MSSYSIYRRSVFFEHVDVVDEAVRLEDRMNLGRYWGGGNWCWEAEQMYGMCFNPLRPFRCQLAYVSGHYLSDHIELSVLYSWGLISLMKNMPEPGVIFNEG